MTAVTTVKLNILNEKAITGGSDICSGPPVVLFHLYSISMDSESFPMEI